VKKDNQKSFPWVEVTMRRIGISKLGATAYANGLLNGGVSARVVLLEFSFIGNLKNILYSKHISCSCRASCDGITPAMTPTSNQTSLCRECLQD